MKFVVTGSAPTHKIQLISSENSNVVEVITPKRRVIEFANNPPNKVKFTVSTSCFGKNEKTEPVELKTRVNEFLGYTFDPRSQKMIIKTKQLDNYPLWPCVKWQLFRSKNISNEVIFMFNFVRKAIRVYKQSGYLSQNNARDVDGEIKINLAGVLEIEQDLLERVLQTDSDRPNLHKTIDLDILLVESVPPTAPTHPSLTPPPPPYDVSEKASDSAIDSKQNANKPNVIVIE